MNRFINFPGSYMTASRKNRQLFFLVKISVSWNAASLPTVAPTVQTKFSRPIFLMSLPRFPGQSNNLSVNNPCLSERND